VLGIEGRQMHVDQASFVFDIKEVERDRYDFVVGDIFETDFRQFGTFDVVLCLGLLYHISKPMELLEKISEVNDDILVVDTTLSMASGSFLKIVPQDPDSYMSAVDRSIAMRPTKRAVRDLAEHFGYSVVRLEPDFRNAKGKPAWAGSNDYRRGSRRAAQSFYLREEDGPLTPIRQSGVGIGGVSPWNFGEFPFHALR
jgi:SAM-dependent methyltransferase